MIYPTTGFQTLLESIKACPEARRWVGERSLAAAWEDCERPDYMLWLVGCMVGQEGWPTHQQLVLTLCAIVETALSVFEAFCPDDTRPRVALATARQWANGEATVEEARASASAAYAATNTAHAAAYAAYAAVYTAYSAAATVYAAYAARAVTYTAYAASLSRCALAQIVRNSLSIPDSL